MYQRQKGISIALFFVTVVFFVIPVWASEDSETGSTGTQTSQSIILDDVQQLAISGFGDFVYAPNSSANSSNASRIGQLEIGLETTLRIKLSFLQRLLLTRMCRLLGLVLL